MPPGGPSNWTPAEDEELRRLIDEHGPKKWSLIASKLKTKGSKQCRRRWKNYLNAELKQGGWSVEEDRILIDGHKKFGNRWTEIAKMVGGRTDNAVKNRWAALCKRNQRMEKGPAATKRGRRARVNFDLSDEEDTTPSPSPTPPSSPRINTRRSQQPQQLQHLHQPQHLQQQPPVMGHALMFSTNTHPGAVAGHTAAAAALAAAAEVVRATTTNPTLNLAAGHTHKRLAPDDMEQLYGGGARKLQRIQVKPETSAQSPRRAFARDMRLDVNMRATGAPSPRSGAKARVGSSGRQDWGLGPTSPNNGGGGGAAGASPQARKVKPQLTLLIPNAAAEPPAQPPANSVQLHVMKDLLSPAEVKYAQELNAMGMPLHIDLGGEQDMLDPPLTTSRRAAQDAVSALVAGSPTGGLGPFSLIGGPPTGAGPSLAPLHIPNSTTSHGNLGTGGDISDLLRWLQQGTPHSARNGSNPFSARGIGGAGPSNLAVQTGPGAGAAGVASPRPMTRSLSRASTPRTALGEGSKQPGSGSGGSMAAAVTTQAVTSPGGTLHDGHRQLLNKLLTQAKTGLESGSGTPVSTLAGGNASTPRRSPRVPSQAPSSTGQQQGQAAGNSGQATPPPHSTGSRRSPRSLTTSAQAAAAFAASAPVPSPLAHGSGSSRRTPGGRLQHSSGITTTASAAAEDNVLASPAGGPSSARSAGAAWQDAGTVMTPGLSMMDINALLDALASPV